MLAAKAPRRALVAAYFPRGTQVTDPSGGIMLWLALPGGVDSLTLFKACLEEASASHPARCSAPPTASATASG